MSKWQDSYHIAFGEPVTSYYPEVYRGCHHEEWCAYIEDLLLYGRLDFFCYRFFSNMCGNRDWVVSHAHSVPQSTF